MIKNLIKRVLPFTILIGTISVMLIIIFGATDVTVVHLQETQIGSYTWKYYTIDIRQYLINLQDNINPQVLLIAMPDRPTLPEMSFGSVLSAIKTISNILFIYITNWLIYIINWLLIFPLKILLYPIQIFLTLIGLNTGANNPASDLLKLYNFDIPLIPTI